MANWTIVARLSADKHDDVEAVVDRLRSALEKRFGVSTLVEAHYPSWAIFADLSSRDPAPATIESWVKDWLFDLAPAKAIVRGLSTSAPKHKREKAIAKTKKTDLVIGSSHYTLEPAASRAHYGEHRSHVGGVGYAYATKSADDAWLVMDRGLGKFVGVLTKGDDDWSFRKVGASEPVPAWLKRSNSSIGTLIYPEKGQLYSGATSTEVLVSGLGIRNVDDGGKTPAQLDAEISAALRGSR